MGQVAQPLRRFFAIEFQNYVNRLTLVLVKSFRISAYGAGAQTKRAAMFLIKRRAHGAICPCLDALIEKRALIPHERPALGVVNELLQLHRSHLPASLEYVFGNVKNTHFHLSRRHGCEQGQPMDGSMP